jgi:hypothetical protein
VGVVACLRDALLEECALADCRSVRFTNDGSIARQCCVEAVLCIACQASMCSPCARMSSQHDRHRMDRACECLAHVLRCFGSGIAVVEDITVQDSGVLGQSHVRIDVNKRTC